MKNSFREQLARAFALKQRTRTALNSKKFPRAAQTRSAFVIC
jgi:hypothetical protein